VERGMVMVVLALSQMFDQVTGTVMHLTVLHITLLPVQPASSVVLPGTTQLLLTLHLQNPLGNLDGSMVIGYVTGDHSYIS